MFGQVCSLLPPHAHTFLISHLLPEAPSCWTGAHLTCRGMKQTAGLVGFRSFEDQTVKMAATIIVTFTQARSLLRNGHAFILRGWALSMLQRNECPLQGGKGGTQKQNHRCMKEQVMCWGWRGGVSMCSMRGAGTPTVELSCECEEGWRGDLGRSPAPPPAPPPPLCPVFISACL